MEFREKFVVLMLTVALLLAWVSVAHAAMGGATAPAGNNLGVNCGPAGSWLEPGDPLSPSGLALPYGTYTTRDLGQGPYLSQYPNQSCKDPGYNSPAGMYR